MNRDIEIDGGHNPTTCPIFYKYSLRYRGRVKPNYLSYFLGIEIDYIEGGYNPTTSPIFYEYS